MAARRCHRAGGARLPDRLSARGVAHGTTAYAPLRIAFTRIPEPEIEEIDPAKSKNIRPRISR